MSEDLSSASAPDQSPIDMRDSFFEFEDPKQYQDTWYAWRQLNMWHHPAIRNNLVTYITDEIEIKETPVGIREELHDEWRVKLITILGKPEYNDLSFGENDVFKDIFLSAKSVARNPKQLLAINVVEQLYLITTTQNAEDSPDPEQLMEILFGIMRSPEPEDD